MQARLSRIFVGIRNGRPDGDNRLVGTEGHRSSELESIEGLQGQGEREVAPSVWECRLDPAVEPEDAANPVLEAAGEGVEQPPPHVVSRHTFPGRSIDNPQDPSSEVGHLVDLQVVVLDGRDRMG